MNASLVTVIITHPEKYLEIVSVGLIYPPECDCQRENAIKSCRAKPLFSEDLKASGIGIFAQMFYCFW
jgi:hypothetical protein